MAEKLCTLRTKGGGGGATQTETVLWTNQSPSSDFAAQTVTLSDDMNNYDYLKVSYENYNAGAGTNDPYNIYISVSDFKTSRYADSTRHNTFTFGGIYAPSNNCYTRQMVYNTDTTVKFGTCTQIGGTSASGNNSIPLQIVGIKVALPPSVGNVKTGTFTIASGVTDTITCGFRPKKIYIYNLESTSKMFADIYDENVSLTYTIGAYKSSSGNGCSSYTIGGGNNGAIQSITDTGFTFKGSGTMSTLYYTAIG